MNSQDLQAQKIMMAANFAENRAPTFHSAFSTASTLNVETREYEPPEVADLRETLQSHQQRAGRYVDFTHDVTKCSWDDVLEQLGKAKEVAEKSKAQGSKNPLKKTWRNIGKASSVLETTLEALPDSLSILHGGLAVIFCLARHDQRNRVRILAAFENVPNIIESAQNRADTFKKDNKNPKSIQLHNHIRQLHAILLTALPALIDIISPGTFLNILRSPFYGYKIDNILNEVKTCAECVHDCAEALVEDIAVQHYSTSLTMAEQMDQLIRGQQELQLQMSMQSAQAMTSMFQYAFEEAFNVRGPFMQRTSLDVIEAGIAQPGLTPDDLRRLLDVHHLGHVHDSRIVTRKSHTLPRADFERALSMLAARQVIELLNDPGPAIVIIDGHFDRAQMGRISPLSCFCAMLSQFLRQQPPSVDETGKPSGPGIVLQYFCSMHIGDKDDLKGPQGLVRSLASQLLLTMVTNRFLGYSEPVNLPHLQDGEEEQLAQHSMAALCRLFVALLRVVPKGIPIYCIVDGWSAFEHDELWRADYESVVEVFREAADASDPDSSVDFRLILASMTRSRLLPDDFVMPGQKVSLKEGARGFGHGRGLGKGGMPDIEKLAKAAAR